jgi:hypothetical protein
MSNLRELASIVSELRAERTNLASQLKHVDAALAVTREVEWRKFVHEAEAHSVGSRSQENQPSAEGTMGKEGTYKRGSRDEAQAHNVSSRKKIAAFQRARWAKVKAQQKKAA